MENAVSNPHGTGRDVPSIQSQMARVRALLERRQFSEALALAQTLAAAVPQNRDVLYLVAVSQRYSNAITDALTTLERLESSHPRFSRLYQERGHCYVTRKDAPLAIAAFLTGVNINPALPKSWSMLEGLYRMTGDFDNAGVAAAHVATLKALPPEIVEATSLFSDGDLAPAESIVRTYLLRHGSHVEAMRLLARIGMAHEVYDDAEVLLAAVLGLAPDYRAARHDYARTLLERHKHLPARRELEALLQLEPHNRQYLTLYATVCVGLGEHEKSIGLYRDLLVDAPRAADLHLSLAHSLKTVGRQQEAIDSYREAAKVRPDFGDAYWSLANLKTYRFAVDELERMQMGESAPATPLVDRYHLCFALGKAFEDRGDYAGSFRFYERGNALKKAESRYQPEILERNTRLQIEVCTPEFFSSRAGVGSTRADPIFIVGLPRAGSTLIEQILASHSKVEGTQELADIPRIVLELQGRETSSTEPRYPGVLAELAPQEFLRLGEKYLSDTLVYRTLSAQGNPLTPFFIDKMPNNFRHIGLIHSLLPNAKIIDARREPMACCFSNFKQLFATGQEFTYDIEDIARYYRTYVELMAHWDAVLPQRILRVDHEAVVDDLEGNVRRILDYCGLEFEPACVDFHKTQRSIRTASSEQVRQPIFRDGLDQWKNYEPWLGPLEAALGDARDPYRR